MGEKTTFLKLGAGHTLTWKERVARFPWSLLFLLLVTTAVGFGILVSAIGGWEHPTLLIRQVIRFSVGVVIMGLVAFLGEEKTYRRYAYVAYGISLALLLAVFLSGTVGMGARRWLDMGFTRLQPSELMKVTLVLALARYFHDRKLMSGFGWQHLLTPLIMVILPLVLVIKQPDLGTGIMMAAVAGTVILTAGLSWKVLLSGSLLLGASLPLAWHTLHGYQRQRILTLFSPEQDPLGAGYHIMQSTIAIGSGGLTGKGFMSGSQSHLEFLPERHTDFIFSVLAEEWGFLGSMTLLLLYALIIVRIMTIAYLAHDRFGLLTVVGLTAMFSFQVVVNIGMVIGLLPVVGIPLPLVSYGGSSMLTIMLAMGLMAHVSIHSKQRRQSV